MELELGCLDYFLHLFKSGTDKCFLEADFLKHALDRVSEHEVELQTEIGF
jgi:hypothetical protein